MSRYSPAIDPTSARQSAVNWGLIVLSFLVALLLNLVPWGRAPAVPDFVALLVVFWGVQGRSSIAIGFLLGLILDVHHGSLLGDHALLYSLLAYGALFLQRVRGLSTGAQIAHVLVLMVVIQVLVVPIRYLTGVPWPHPAIFVQWLSTALLWPVANWLLLAGRRRQQARRSLP